MKTLAALSTAPDAPFTLTPVELDEIRPDELLVRIVAAGICHTDLTFKAKVPAPAVYGHEGAGIVERTGAKVSHVRPGDRVLLSFGYCGSCRHCRAAVPGYCSKMQQINASGFRADGSPTLTRDGSPLYGAFFGQSSFAQHVITSQNNVVVAKNVPDLAIAAPLGCGFQTGAGAVLNVLKLAPDDSLVIFGAGAVGLSALLAARMRGTKTLIAVDPVPSRRQLARELGATAVFEPGPHIVSRVHEATAGGAGCALDTTGKSSVVADALSALDSRGTLVVVGLGDTHALINVSEVMLAGKTLRGCTEGDALPQEFVPQLLREHGRGRFPIDKLIVKYPFTAINEAVADMRAGRVIQPVLTWT
ncbi:NAD(P)-dependent alcohol dehydrogenase [Hoyosella sp. YIM 151337]|uniref:NAD(P)-dependent alcohol dehydrogenase n=1 Tax=Hoyosella sp. YIM 151337 TaxID=2992742 RepID=UPI002235B9C7|nr:NAD(P)-dependent alcohol dehydrogenase [Hoyosella sp. YIM 151337]MCW4353703.1 NAD(P)-dependent alcohol dehydrogenase [Hoyosella sp. YIM 151337]